MQGVPVKLYVYDLSGGLAATMSRALVGRQIDGIWYVSEKKNWLSASLWASPRSFGTDF